MKNAVIVTVFGLLTIAPALAAQGTTAASTKVVCATVLKAKVNLNKASEAELGCLKAVSPTIAKDIIANRPFKDAADFAKKIEDIGKKLYDMNKASVKF